MKTRCEGNKIKEKKKGRRGERRKGKRRKGKKRDLKFEKMGKLGK